MSREGAPAVIQEDLHSLIARAKAGEQKAYEALYTSLYTPVYRFLLSRTRNREDAEDLAGDTFIKFFNALDRFVPLKDSALPYLFTIARNIMIDKARSKNRELVVDEEFMFALPDHGPSPAEQSELWDDISSLQEAIAKLPEGEQAALTLRYFDNLSMKEVADVLNKKEDAVRQLVSRGLRRLRTIVLEHHESKA